MRWGHYNTERTASHAYCFDASVQQQYQGIAPLVTFPTYANVLKYVLHTASNNSYDSSK